MQRAELPIGEALFSASGAEYLHFLVSAVNQCIRHLYLEMEDTVQINDEAGLHMPWHQSDV